MSSKPSPESKPASVSLLTTQPPLANPEDIAIPQCVNTADEAIALVRQRHAKWLQGKG
jgi:hypothetical protein